MWKNIFRIYESYKNDAFEYKDAIHLDQIHIHNTQNFFINGM